MTIRIVKHPANDREDDRVLGTVVYIGPPKTKAALDHFVFELWCHFQNTGPTKPEDFIGYLVKRAVFVKVDEPRDVTV